MMDILKTWVEVRERIFQHNGVPPAEMWAELADAEHKLMDFGREALKNPKMWGWSEAQRIAHEWAKKKD